MGHKNSKSNSSSRKEVFVCRHGHGNVCGDKCSVRTNKNMCPKGHPCKRV